MSLDTRSRKVIENNQKRRDDLKRAGRRTGMGEGEGGRRRWRRYRRERGGGGGRGRKGVNEVYVDEQGGLVHVGGRRRG